MRIRRGWVYEADLSTQPFVHPQLRLVLVAQTNLLNNSHPATLVVPLTYAIVLRSKYLRVHVPAGEAGLERPADVMIDLVRTINNKRFVKALGELSGPTMDKVGESLGIILGLTPEAM